MKLTFEGIKDTAAWQRAGIKLPEYDVQAAAEKAKVHPVWAHFGAGNIFRIFVGGLADTLIAKGEMDRGITCVETFDFDVVDQIYAPYDNLVLAVTLNADATTDKRVLGSLSEAIKAQSGVPEAWNRLKAVFADPSLQMVSFTITEKGYALKNAAGAFFPFVQADIDNGPDKATGAMAIVCAMLLHRFESGKAPLAVVSMDNCSHNGEKPPADESARQTPRQTLRREKTGAPQPRQSPPVVFCRAFPKTAPRKSESRPSRRSGASEAAASTRA